MLPLKEYTGTMQRGMDIMLAFSLLQVLLSGIMVWFTREELIFPDRVAPKFAFDTARAVITLGFALFWM